MGSPLHSLCLFYRPCYKGVGVINNICYNIFKITSRSVVRCFRQKFSGEQVHLRTPSERCEVGMCSLALPPSRTQSNLLSSLSHPWSETQALLLSRWDTAKLSERRVTCAYRQIGGRELVETGSEPKFWSVQRGELSVLHKPRGEHTASRVF